MMLAMPMMAATPNDVWLRHVFRQTSHHCDRKKQHHFERSEKMLCDIIAKMSDANFASRKEKTRFCEKICLKNKSYIKKIMEEEKNIIEKYIISFKAY